MRKRVKKTREEKLSENFFPVDESDLKHSVEKVQKDNLNLSEFTIEKRSSKKKFKRRAINKKISAKKVVERKKKSSSSKKSSAKNYEPVKVDLKKNGYELVVTEKPQAALKIADALGKSVKRNLHGVPYYEVSRGGKKIIVACAVGHLFTLGQIEKGTKVPTFNIQWVPNFLVRKKDFTKKYYDTLLSLAKSAGSLTVATDYDVEGEVIGLNVVRFICNQKDASRMKFSTLTKKELDSAYENKSANLNWGQAIAGESRHYLDWFYGINLSRALMNSIKEAGMFKIMSIGRVQGPALNLIVQRERKINAFQPEKYFQVFIKVDDNKNQLELKYIKDIFDKNELDKFRDIIGKTAEAETKKREEIVSPNPPFNLTSLQIEAYRLYGLTPARTLQIAQSLYLNGLISYPRTSSQKLPDSIAYKEILEKLAKQFRAEKLIRRSKPVEGEKTDPAHPSIYPTGNIGTMNEDEERIYNLIAKRFLCLFCEDAIIDKKRIAAKVDGLIFATSGSSIRKKAWIEIYPHPLKENLIPDMNGIVKITDSRIEEKETQPPKRYSPASIVSELEKRNLGTKATRASIIETLYDRGYIKEKSIEATPLGISLISTLEKYSPIIIDEELTRNFEKEMEEVSELKSGFEDKERKIIEGAKKTIVNISKDFEKNKKDIGQGLLDGETELRAREKEENKLNICPACGKGNLAIMYSRKTRRSFVACDAYPNCKTTYSLPPNGIIKKTGKICEHCGFPTLMRLSKGKRPWTFCFNPNCESNKEWAQKRENKEAEKV